MATYTSRLADGTKILMKREMATVLGDLRRKALRSKNARLNLVIFRLAACCGLRASEIANLQMADVRVEMPRPHLRIRASTAKGGRPRMVPLWWDRGTYRDLVAWRADRLARGAKACSSFIYSGNRSEVKLYYRGTRFENDFAPPAKFLAPNDSRRSQFTTGGTRLSAMHWLGDGPSRKLGTPPATPTSVSLVFTCTSPWRKKGWSVCLDKNIISVRAEFGFFHFARDMVGSLFFESSTS